MPSPETLAFLRQLATSPVIAAARTAHDVQAAETSPVSTVFLLGGSILTMEDTVARLREKGRTVFVHIDLIEGLGRDPQAVEWCVRHVRPDGLISTHSQLLRRAADRGLITIQRLFLVDSSSLESGLRHLSAAPPDVIEVLPGLVSKAIGRIRDELSLPVIAGGMINVSEEARQALEAGACAVSTSERSLWGMTI